LVCNAEMVLMEAAQADPTTLPGFEHRTFYCPACHAGGGFAPLACSVFRIVLHAALIGHAAYQRA
jgi:hypothetical protein